MLGLELVAKDKYSKARAGIFHTGHGSVQTPVFMPVGTQGTVKAVNQDFLKNHLNSRILLSNTYHLYLRPGVEILEKAGGLHRLMNWESSILTDSGGFQIFSLADLRRLKKDGVEFKSHLDGSKHFFTPQKVLEIQRSIGSDIMMVLDECTPFPCEYEYAQQSVKLTSEWAAIAKNSFENSSANYGYTQNLFGIIQGSTYKDLREKSAKEIISLEFDPRKLATWVR
ncbi:MAG: tRNA-guanine transglycosylase, partial [Ignavibacteriaceae bacterium]|nr:tRNA-guanine transglycosylase [Ignavibacteriaceae bacterium]